jgi:DNA-3-methyladenine glycosylase II
VRVDLALIGGERLGAVVRVERRLVAPLLNDDEVPRVIERLGEGVVDTAILVSDTRLRREHQLSDPLAARNLRVDVTECDEHRRREPSLLARGVSTAASAGKGRARPARREGHETPPRPLDSETVDTAAVPSRDTRSPKAAPVRARTGSAARSARKRRVSHTEAASVLAERDAVIARLLADAGPPRFRRPHDSPFAALVRAIVYQQLAGAAAAAIHGRLIDALGADVRPEVLLALPDESLRSAGLSKNKMSSLRDLATKALDGTLELTPRGLSRQDDAEVTERLSSVRGIGPWTADMFMMFQLRRLDIWPTGDFGVRRGYGLAWGIAMPSAKELEPLGEPYRPYRSIAAWYCWRAVELYAGAGDSALTR